MPSVAAASSRATAGVSYVSARRNASTRSASPARTATGSPNCAHVLGRPRRVSSSSSAGRSSWTSENECTSSTAHAAGSTSSGSAPIASPTARQSTGRIRLPPPSSAYRNASSRPAGPAGLSSASASSTSSRSSSTFRIRLGLGFALRPLDLRLDLSGDLRELAEDLERGLGLLGRLQPRAGGLEAVEQALRALQALFCAHARSVSSRPMAQTLRRIVGSSAFDTVIITVILANAVVLGLQTYPDVVAEHGDTLNLLNGIFLGIFVVELLLRIGSFGRRPQAFFRSGWNVFDFVVVGSAFLPVVRESSTLLRLARLLRVVRIVRLLPDLRILLQGVVRSLPPLFSMTMLVTLLLFVYGMIGWLLFGDELPDDWGTIGAAMLTLFVMLTLENFPAYMDAGMSVHPWSWIYFVTFVLIAAFMVLNVLIGIVLHSMEEAREIERRRALGADVDGDISPAPVAERIAMLRAALTELEDELRLRARAESDRGSR